MFLKIDKRLELKDQLIEYIQKLRSNSTEASKFYDKIRIEIIEIYPKLFIPADELFAKIISKNQICSLFTISEDYKLNEVEFYTKFFKEYIKEEKSFPVGLENFMHLMQAIKNTFQNKFLKKRK